MKSSSRPNTKTSSFGVSERRNHDSTAFYNANIYTNANIPTNVKYLENCVPDEYINQIFCKSSEKMEELPDCSVHLMITSPPYNVGKEYDNNLHLDDYFNLLRTVFQETYRVLVPGGRAAINIANVGRKPYISLNSEVTRIMSEIGFFMRGEIIWQKGASAGGSCAWGSWQSASNPVLRDTHEYIMIFSKSVFKRENPTGKENTITRDEFLEYTKSVWEFNTESAKKVKHPAPFPIELPRRLIQLYSFKDDVILDPFMGVGSTAIASLISNRNFVGYEISEEYYNIAKKRIESNKPQKSQKRIDNYK